jgi:RHS repeat-associated protein
MTTVLLQDLTPSFLIAKEGVIHYFHNDHLGTPQVLTDRNQKVVWQADYRPFGKADILIANVENPFGFPGQYYDQETELHYNWFRHYNPNTGRYITPDPIGLKGGMNPYLYVGNDPVNIRDPRGLWGEDVHSGIGNPTYGTYIWARQLGFSEQEATWIALGDNGTDGGFASWWFMIGTQSRHFNQLHPTMKGFCDSRDYWASLELDRAVNYYEGGNSRAAYGHLGKGLHSIQDKIAHRDWNTGLIGWDRHPNWYDDWDDPRNALNRSLTEAATKQYMELFLSLRRRP